MSHRQLPLSPPVPPPDISDVVNKYLPQSAPQATPVGANRSSPVGLAQSAISTRTPSREASSSQLQFSSPHQRTEKDAVKDEAELLAERAFARAVKPATVETPDSRLLNRGLSGVSNPDSASRYAAAYTPRSPNTAEFRTRYADPQPDDVLQSLRNRVNEMEKYEETYSTSVDVFRKQAEIDKREKTGLLSNVQKLRAQVMAVEDSREQVEQEKSVLLQRRDEDCNRKILNMRKSLLLSEQAVGSLRTENEELAAKAAALDIQREECDALRRQIFQMNQNMTLLAQQNEQLQRALKRKEQDVQSDLDVYVKQLDVVQAQSAAMKKDMDIMNIKLRSQETLQQEIDTLRQQNLDLQAAINEVDKEAAELQERHAVSLQEKDDDCAREVVNFRRQVIALEKQVESLALQNQHLTNKHRPQQITDEINRLAGQVAALTEENDQKNRQLEALQRAVVRKDEEREQDVTELQTALESAQSRVNNLAADLRSEQVARSRMEEELRETKIKLDDMRVSRDNIEADMHSRQRELQCQLDVLSHRANTNQNEADTLKALAAAMEEKHRAAVEILRTNHQAELREALKRKDDQYSDAIADHVKQLEISSRLTSSVRSDNANLAAEVARLSSDASMVEPLRAKVAQLEQQIAHREEEASVDLQTFNSQADALTRELNAMRNERDDARSELFEAQQRLDAIKAAAETVPALEQELQAVREKVIDMNADAIRSQRAHVAKLEELQNHNAVLEKQLNENLKMNSSTRELEFAVRNRQLSSENDKLRDLIRQVLPEAVVNAASPNVNAVAPQTPSQQDVIAEAVAQALRARQSPSASKTTEEAAATPVASVPQVKVPPLDMSRAVHSPMAGSHNNVQIASPVAYLSKGGSMYDASTGRSEELISPAASNIQPGRATSEETVDAMLYGRPIAYGNQPQNSMHFETLPRLFEQAATLLGDSVAVRSEKRTGDWEELSWTQYYLRSFQFAKALIAEDMRPFQGVVLCAANSAEWMTAFCGSIFAGGLPVACHPGWGPRHCFRIASDANAHVVLVDSGKSLQKFLALKDQLPSVKHLVLFRESVPPALKSLHGDFILSLDQFLARANHATDESIAHRGDNIMVEHAAAVLFTSGTLGEPKGVVLSHDNLSFTAQSILLSHFQDQTMPTTMSFALHGEAQGVILDIVLPMLFVCQRHSTFTVSIPRSGTNTVASSLRAAKPTFVAAPPHILAEIANELTIAPKSDGDAKLAAWASKVSLDASKNRQDLVDIAPIKGAGMAQQVNERIRATIGLDRCTHIIGLGAMPLTISEQLAQAGVDVLEVYGCVETSGFATLSTAFHYRFGTAGVRLPGTDIRIDFNEGLPQRKEGEILVRGRNVMLGYLANEELTRRTLDNEGWVRTGDLGRVDDLNLLTVVGRVKELFTTLNGERISPAVIEAELRRQCPALSNVVVVGDRRKYVVALVTLKCKRNPDTGAWTDDLAGDALSVNPDVLTVTTARRDKKWLDYIAQVVSIYNSQAPSNLHKVRRFCILSSDISNEEMTPTKKIKRQLVTDRCINIIEKLYAEDSPRSSTTK